MYENIFAGFAIDTNDPALADSFAPIPEGYYPAVVESIEQGLDKSGGVRFTAKTRLRDCPFNGRVILENFNVGSSNPQAVEIGRKQLAALARACGINGVLTSPQQVIGVPIYVKIPAQKPDEKYAHISAWLTVDAGQRLAGNHTGSKPAMSAPQLTAFVPPAAPAFAAPAAPQPQPAAPAFVAPQQAAQPAFVPPVQPQPAAPMQAAPVAQPAVFPAQPAAQPVAATSAHKMPWEQ